LKTVRQGIKMETNNIVQDGFKMTELGPLPEEWEIVKIDKIGKLITGNTPSKKQKEYWDKGEIDFIKPPDLQNRLIMTFSEKISRKAKNVARITNKGSVLVSCIGILGRVGYTKNTVAFNQQINAVEPNRNIRGLFLFYILQMQKQQIENLASFTTVPIVSKAKFCKIKIPLPPLPEQKKIAGVLGAVQEAKEKTEQVIKAAKELKKSLMKHLFTYGPVSLEEAQKVKLKETEIGMIAEKWNLLNFKKCIIKKRIQVNKIKQRQYKDFGKYPVIDQGKDLIAGYWDNEKDVYQGVLPIIIFGDHTRIIKFVDFPFVCGADGTKIIVPDTLKIDTSYFYYALLNTKITSRGYNRHYSLLKEKNIPIPNFSEQRKIADILSSIEQKIEAEENKKKALEELFKSLLNNLMTGKIRVNNLDLEL